MSYVNPDRIFEVPIQGGELHISPSMDFLHFFPPLDAYMLKYFNMDAEPPRMCNILMSEAAAQFLMNQCDVEVVFRGSMSEKEHEQWITWAADQLSDADIA